MPVHPHAAQCPERVFGHVALGRPGSDFLPASASPPAGCRARRARNGVGRRRSAVSIPRALGSGRGLGNGRPPDQGCGVPGFLTSTWTVKVAVVHLQRLSILPFRPMACVFDASFLHARALSVVRFSVTVFGPHSVTL